MKPCLRGCPFVPLAARGKPLLAPIKVWQRWFGHKPDGAGYKNGKSRDVTNARLMRYCFPARDAFHACYTYQQASEANNAPKVSGSGDFSR